MKSYLFDVLPEITIRKLPIYPNDLCLVLEPQFFYPFKIEFSPCKFSTCKNQPMVLNYNSQDWCY